MTKGKIDVTKIDKSRLFKGAKGTYLDIVLHDNKNGTDEFGNDGFIAMDVTKEQREAGERGPIIGNWRFIGGKPTQKPAAPAPRNAPPRPPVDDPDLDDVPFNREAHAPR